MYKIKENEKHKFCPFTALKKKTPLFVFLLLSSIKP